MYISVRGLLIRGGDELISSQDGSRRAMPGNYGYYYICINKYIYIYIYIHVHIYIYIYIERERERAYIHIEVPLLADGSRGWVYVPV